MTRPLLAVACRSSQLEVKLAVSVSLYEIHEQLDWNVPAAREPVPFRLATADELAATRRELGARWEEIDPA